MPRVSKDGINKSQWIREQPPSLTPKEVVDRAKKENIALTVQQVYTVRHAAKQKAETATAVTPSKPGRKPGAAKPGPKPRSTSTTASASSTSSSVTQEFAKLAVRLGTDQMRRLIDQLDHGQAVQ